MKPGDLVKKSPMWVHVYAYKDEDCVVTQWFLGPQELGLVLQMKCNAQDNPVAQVAIRGTTTWVYALEIHLVQRGPRP